MGISLRTHKVLWGRPGGRCAICKRLLVLDAGVGGDDLSIIGDEAHIIGRKETFTRGDYDSLTPEERDEYANLILLCKNDHKLIDDQPAQYTVERLHQIKTEHETEIRTGWTSDDERHQQDDEIYASYIDDWAKRSELDRWVAISSWLDSDDAPMVSKAWYDSARDVGPWVLSRIWPGRYRRLEEALVNYAHVLRDMLEVFNRHIDQEYHATDWLRTRKFYQTDEWDQAKYFALGKKYDDHVTLVCDLFLELTRAANYVCDYVRECLSRRFRLREGALLARCNVGFALKTEFLRPEYRGAERVERPYPGLKGFLEARYTRDVFINPNS